MVENSATAYWFQHITLLGWVSLLTVGLIGFTVPYTRPAAATEHTPEPIEMVEVELPPPIRIQPVLADSQTPTASEQPPAIARNTVPDPLPELIPVAPLSDAIVFPLPVAVQKEVIPLEQASTGVRASSPSSVSPEPTTQTLTFGRGEGIQPPPRYPRQALRERQEGKVKVQFDVGSNGKVTAVDAIEPSPWPVLNREAVRVIRDSWSFPAGPTRRYEVVIDFQIPR